MLSEYKLKNTRGIWGGFSQVAIFKNSVLRIFIYSFTKHILKTYYVPDIIPGAGNIKMCE